MDLLHAATLFQILFLILYLFRRRKEPGIGLFIGLFAVTGFTVLIGYLYQSALIFRVPDLARMGFPLAAMTGPLLYLSIRNYATMQTGLIGRDLVFFLIPAAEFCYLIPFFLLPVSDKIVYLQEDALFIHDDCLVFSWIAFSNNTALLIYAWIRHMRMNQIKIKKGDTITGIFRMTYIVVLILSMIALIGSLFRRNLVNSGIFSGIYTGIILILGYGIVWRLLDQRHTDFYQSDKSGKYAKALIPGDQLDYLAGVLDRVLRSDKLYLDNELSLSRLSEVSGISPASLSRS